MKASLLSNALAHLFTSPYGEIGFVSRDLTCLELRCAPCDVSKETGHSINSLVYFDVQMVRPNLISQSLGPLPRALAAVYSSHVHSCEDGPGKA